MSEKLNPNDFGLKLYNRFPPSYRLDDVDQKYALKRYLEAAADGGFKYVIEEQNGILDLIDPHTAPLDVIYLLYEQYGLELFHGIPEEFLRAFLPNLGLAWSKKGSLDVVEYIVSSLSGIKTSTEVTYDGDDNPFISVRLEMDYNILNYFPDSKQFNRILSKFIPFYCDFSLFYYYMSDDYSTLHGTDLTFESITYNQKETGIMFYDMDDSHKDNILQLLQESSDILSNSSDIISDKVSVNPFNDSFTLSGEDISLPVSITHIHKETESLNYDMDSDLTDSVSEVLQESTDILSNSSDAVFDRVIVAGTLNDSFMLNGITTSDTTEFVIVLSPI